MEGNAGINVGGGGGGAGNSTGGFVGGNGGKGGDGADGAMAFLSIPASAGAGGAELCKGDKVACSTGSGQKIMSFVAATALKLSSRAVFRGEKNITPVDGETLTVVLRKSDGSALEARSYIVRRK